MPGESDVIFASYNIHGCVGTDRNTDVERVASVLRSLEADVIGLQEVDCRHPQGDGPDQLAQLTEATGLASVPGPTIRDQEGYYGNALLTRFPVVDVVRTSLNYPNREPRGMLDVILRVGATRVRVLVTHFGLIARERRHQVNVVLRILEIHEAEVAIARPFDALVLLGDFNEWRPRSITLGRLHAALGRSPAIRTYPSRFPLFALDRIWTQPKGILRTCQAIKSPVTRVASDHLPLRAVLNFEHLANE